MFCRKCGAQNEDGAKFCGKCGEKLVEIKVEKHQEETPRREHSGTKAEKKKKGKVIAVIFGVILLLLALALAGFFVRKTLKEKQYADAMDRGQKYLEELDYENAEAEFLEALSIDPKEPEPYLVLSDLYLAQDEPEKAIEILELAAENVPEEVQKEMKKSDQKDIGEKLEEVKNLEKYTWVVEPEIEADDIFYLADYPDMEHSVNELSKQADNPNAVIQRGSEFGIIDFSGKLLAEVAYKEIANFGDHYMMISTVPKYSEEYDQDWEIYWLDKDGKIDASVGNGSFDSSLYYYYKGTRQRTGYTGSNFVKETIPVQESSVYDLYDIALIMENLSGKYALEYNGELITDFVYDECGSLSDGLFAVCQNGKWGYVDEKGQVVIPLEYDTSWEQYPVFDGGSTRSTDNVKKYCYAASDGYVTLCKDGKWELRNTKGTLVIMPGVFEKICPVYDGKCWVKRNGKWGVIALEGDEDDTTSKSEEIDYEALYGPLVQEVDQTYENYNIYFKYDIDKDGVDELLLEEGTCEADYMYHVYTIQNKKSVSLGTISGNHSMFYADEEGGKAPYIYKKMGYTGWEALFKVEIKDGKVQETQLFERELGPDDEPYENEYPLSYTTVDDLFLLKH